MRSVQIPAIADDGSEWRWTWATRLAIENKWQSGAELGVRRAHFSVYLVDHVPGLKMLAVDTWAQREGVSSVYARYRHDRNYEHVLSLAHERPIEVWRMTTHEASGLVPAKSLDFAFIDASHEYESVSQDIEDWLPKVRHMLMGHDWMDNDVRMAVEQRFPEVMLGPDRCWAVRV